MKKLVGQTSYFLETPAGEGKRLNKGSIKDGKCSDIEGREISQGPTQKGEKSC